MSRIADALSDFELVLASNPTLALAHVGRGMCLNAVGQFQQAVAEYNKAINLDGADGEAYLGRGVSYFNSGQLKPALSDFERAEKLAADRASQCLHFIGMCHAASGDHRSALTFFNRALVMTPPYIEAYFGRGCSHFALGHFDEAIKNFEQALSGKTRNPVAARYLSGQAYFRLGQYEKALLNFELASSLNPNLEQEPEFVNVNYARALRCLKLNAYEEALSWFEKTGMVAADATMQAACAHTCEKLNQFSKAAEHYSAALLLKKQDPELLCKRGNCYMLIHEKEKARADFALAASVDNNCAAAACGFGYLSLSESKAEEAIRFFDQAIAVSDRANTQAKDHRYPQAYLGKSTALAALGRQSEALQYADFAIRFDPDQIEPYLLCGYLYNQMQRYDEARTTFDNAARLNPHHPAIHHGRGVACLGLGTDLSQALKELKLATDLVPNNAQYLTFLGKAYMQSGSLQEAIAAFRKAVALKPDLEEANIDLAEALMRGGMTDEAIDCLKRLLAIKPNCQAAYVEWGRVHERMSDFEAAVESYSKALAMKAGDWQALTRRGSCLIRLKQTDRAIADLKAAAGINPKNGAALKELALLFCQRNEPAQAIDELNDYLSLDSGDISAWTLRAQQYQLLSQWEKAKSDYRSALYLDGGCLDARVGLGVCLSVLKDYNNACTEFQTAISRGAQAKNDRRFVWYYVALGQQSLANESNQAALSAFDLALTIDQSLPEVHFGRAQSLVALKRYEESIADFEAASESELYRDAALINVGEMYYLTRKYRQAEKLFLAVLANKPDNPKAMYYLGVVRLYMSLFNQAVDTLDRALILSNEPGKNFGSIPAKVHYFIANAYYQLGSFAKALFEVNRFLVSDPDDLDGLLLRGMCRLKLKHNREANSDFETLKKLAPRAAHSLCGRGYSELEKKKHKAAVDQFKKAIELNSEFTPALIGRGQACLSLKKADLAAADFQSVLNLNPDSLPALQGLFEAYAKTGGDNSPCLQRIKDILDTDQHLALPVK
jgi:tetratricopeptide (TPR) repeat protein